MPSAKDVLYPATVNITFDNEVGGEVKGRPAAENRRPAVLRVGVPEGGTADLAEDYRPVVLCSYWGRDQKREAEERSGQLAHHASECARHGRNGSLTRNQADTVA
jgi:hypothetical protein